MSSTYVALLRGINVGGKNTLPMPRLAALFTAAGCQDVSTYIQSGNVVFRADAALAARLPALITAAIAKDHKLDIPVILRQGSDLKKVAAAYPFPKTGAGIESAHVAFLAGRPAAAAVAALDPERSAPDKFKVIGSEIHLYLPNGAGRSKLSNQYFDSKLKTTSTMRNWKTLMKLIELTHG